MSKEWTRIKKKLVDDGWQTKTSNIPKAGMADWGERMIYVNPKKANPIETFLHEGLHIIKPDAEELVVESYCIALYDFANLAEKEEMKVYFELLRR